MTNLEYIQSRYPLHAQRIVEEITAQNSQEYVDRRLNDNYEKGWNPLVFMFDWDYSEEGWNYWTALADD